MAVVPGKQRAGRRVIHTGRRATLLQDRSGCYHEWDVTEPAAVNKPRPTRSLAELTTGFLADAFKKQGFASTELVTRWQDIVGPEIAAHAEPIKLQWARPVDGEPTEPATLVLRVEGPAAIEIQHLSNVILERVNRFFGWQAVARIALRQAPLARRAPRRSRSGVDDAEAARVAETLTAIGDDDLRMALARLAAAVKRG
jgi:hypothetical protein